MKQASTLPSPPLQVPVATSGGDVVDLPKGRALQPEETLEITSARPARVVIAVGAAGSGKTTLLASMYERFLRQPWANYMFAGSSTLLGFEKICHDGRGASCREEPATLRTSRAQGRQFLHLRVRDATGQKPIRDLLLSDLSGEEFDDARNSSHEARELAIVKAAYHVLLLVDGAKLADIHRRQAARDAASLLLRTLIEEGLLDATSRLDILFTKWDVAGYTQESRAFVELVEKELRSRCEAHVARVRAFRVAARDPSGTHMPATGLEDAIASWVEDERVTIVAPPTARTEPMQATEYDRFYRRQLPGHFLATSP